MEFIEFILRKARRKLKRVNPLQRQLTDVNFKTEIIALLCTLFTSRKSEF